MLKFSPPPGEVAIVQADALDFQVYLTTGVEVLQEQSYAVRDSKNKARYDFSPISAPVLGGVGEQRYVTWQATVPLSSEYLDLDYIVSQGGNDRCEGSISIRQESDGPELEIPFKMEVPLSENEFEISVRIPWLQIEDWEGWLWVRSRYLFPLFPFKISSTNE